MNVIQYKERKRTERSFERPMSWRKPQDRSIANGLELALWVVVLILVLTAMNQWAKAQALPPVKPETNGAVDKPEVKLDDKMQFDELTQLKMSGLFKDLTIADQSMKLAQQAFKDAQDSAKTAQESLQKEYDAFLVKNKLDKGDWLFDPNKWGWALIRKPVENVVAKPPQKKETP